MSTKALVALGFGDQGRGGFYPVARVAGLAGRFSRRWPNFLPTYVPR